MITITTTADLAEFCTRAASQPYVTIDTEFLRERTYYAKLCLVQLAIPETSGPETSGPETSGPSAVLVDPLAEGLSLQPLYALLSDPGVVKVFHAARQDLEIFFIEGGVIPSPLFDTQVAAMVCGFGEQAGYETLVRKIVRQPLDKSSRFTDWSRRPLSEAQMRYAIGDVTHLRVIYEYLAAALKKSGRQNWVEEEMKVLNAPETYVVAPENAWRRVKTRTNSGRFLAVVRELARFREIYAQAHNVPRSRVYKDDAMLELASTKPRTHQDIGRSRLLLREARRGEIADGILESVRVGTELPPEDCPKADKRRESRQVNPALADLLRVLLKAKAEDAGVAQKLIATAADLDAIAAGERDAIALNGWRRDVFGADALRLCDGGIGLAVRGEKVDVIEL